MGEALGPWHLGGADDAILMTLITSANIATGFHAGDPNLMDETVRLARQHGVGIGAHPGYRDLHGFGRRRIDAGVEELVNDIVYQVGALQAFAARHGQALQHVKPHGALYMELARNEKLSLAFVEAMGVVAPNAFIFCLDGSETCRAAEAAGRSVIREFYADRDYDRSGSIVFTRRGRPLDPQAVADKLMRACLDGRVRTVDGGEIDIVFDSICFHSDTPDCARLLQVARNALHGRGVGIDRPGRHCGPG
jgi:5-oxoprolinase (ATP-hydrolysing) subunit A